MTRKLIKTYLQFISIKKNYFEAQIIVIIIIIIIIIQMYNTAIIIMIV